MYNVVGAGAPTRSRSIQIHPSTRAGAAAASSVYGTVMPLLRQRLAHAVARKVPYLVSALVEAMGALAEAAGAPTVLADAHAVAHHVLFLALCSHQPACISC